MPGCQPHPLTPDRVFTSGGRAVARLSDDGLVWLADQPAPMLPYIGYTACRPSPRLIDALGALLAQDLRQTHGASLNEAP